MTDALSRHIPLTADHVERAIALADLINSCATSAREAMWRGSFPLALHHICEARLAMFDLIPLAKRLSAAALEGGDNSQSEAA